MSPSKLFHLDASNRFSYLGHGKTWHDISGNDYHAKGDPNSQGSGTSDDRFPIWEPENGGRFYFDGYRGLNIEDDLGNHENGAHIVWLKQDKESEYTKYIADPRNGTGSEWFSNQRKMKIEDMSLAGQWVHGVLTGNKDGTSKLYINGRRVDSPLLDDTPVDFDIGRNFRIGNRYTSDGRWTGHIGEYCIFDGEVSAEFVSDHYNRTKSRYL